MTPEELGFHAARISGFPGLQRSTVGVLAFVPGGKVFGEPTRKALIMDLAPDSCKAGMFGRYYLIRDIVVSVDALGGAFRWQISPEANLLTAFGSGVIDPRRFAFFGRDMRPSNR